MNLYAVYLGGDFEQDRMGEDHEVVLVVAEDDQAAKVAARAKWRGFGRPHIDALRRIERVDGYDVVLRPGEAGDSTALDQTFEPADPA